MYNNANNKYYRSMYKRGDDVMPYCSNLLIFSLIFSLLSIMYKVYKKIILSTPGNTYIKTLKCVFQTSKKKTKMKYKPTDTKQLIVNELHKPARKNFKRRRIIIKGLDDTWQADLIELCTYSRENSGFKYILVVIDNFSKYVWTQSLKSKSAKEVTNGFTKILANKLKRKPKNLQTDEGKEFFNANFKALMLKHKINHYKTFTIIKAAIVERVIRTLKGELFKLFSLHGSYKWIDKIDDVVKRYNNKCHRTILLKPVDVNKQNEKILLNTVYNHIKVYIRRKFRIGDIVRISKFKHVFNKGYTPNWTAELFRIVKIKTSNPSVYFLEDMNKKPIAGAFYKEELQKTAVKDGYLIEKVLKKRTRNNIKEIYVKWYGLPVSENQWIPESNIM